MIWRVMTAIGFGATAGVLGWWIAQRTPPVDLIEWELLTPVVRPGQDLKVRYSVLRRESCETRYQRTYRDGEGARFVLDEHILISTGPMGRDSYVSLVTISHRAVQGDATFRGVIMYNCNPVHSIWPIVQVLPPVKFRIEGDPVGVSIETIPLR